MPFARVPDRIGVVGDVHGDARLAAAAIVKLAAMGIFQIHFAGDFGIPGPGRSENDESKRLLGEALDAAPGVEVLVTLGNHERYELMDTLTPDEEGVRWWMHSVGFLPRGWRGTTRDGRVLASLGGANSIDRFIRAAIGLHWTPREQITEDDLTRLGTAPVDVLIGHDAPTGLALTARLKETESLWEAGDLAYAAAGQRMFHRAVLEVRPKLTVSGHYHLFVDSLERYVGEDGVPFESHCVVLNCDGRYPTAGIVDLRTLEFTPLRMGRR